jgi:hypothetical protein
LTVTKAAEDLDAVLLDLHARAASIALLPSPQLVIDFLNIDWQSRRQTLNDRDERASV